MRLAHMTVAFAVICAALVMSTYASTTSVSMAHSFSSISDIQLFWEHGGDAHTIQETEEEMATTKSAAREYMRLTEDRQSRSGMMWSQSSLPFDSWETTIHFRVHGQGSNLFGDGFAFWAVTEPLEYGPAFGADEYFEGLGVFFDTYQNVDLNETRVHPLITASANDGTKLLFHSADGYELLGLDLNPDEEYDEAQLENMRREHMDEVVPELGSCSAFFRFMAGQEGSSRVRIKYDRPKKTLTVQLDLKNRDSWFDCLKHEDVVLPGDLYFGFSASTGHLADNHDIYSMETVIISDESPVDALRGTIVPAHSIDFFTMLDVRENWQAYANARMVDDRVRLTTDRPNQVGGLWNRVAWSYSSWETVVSFQMHGEDTKNYGDGIGMWFVSSPLFQPGPLLGFMARFQGLGIMLHSNYKKHPSDSYSKSVVRAVVNDGRSVFDASSGKVLGECSLPFRHLDNSSSSRVRVRYFMHVLTVEVDPKDDGNFVDCISVVDVDIPKGFYFGLTGKTGHLADIHDVVSVETYNLDFEEKYSLYGDLTKPMSLGSWDLKGRAAVVNEEGVIRLTEDHQSQRGALWNREPLAFDNWQVLLNYRVHGQGEHLFGDGFAFWLTQTSEYKPGKVFGADMEHFVGLGLFFDTYNNQDAESHGHEHPYIRAVISDGKATFSEHGEGDGDVLGGCTTYFRQRTAEKMHMSRAEISFYDGTLTVRVDATNTDDWITCVRISNIALPPAYGGYHFGLSSATGALADNHDIVSLLVRGVEKRGLQPAMTFSDAARLAGWQLGGDAKIHLLAEKLSTRQLRRLRMFQQAHRDSLGLAEREREGEGGDEALAVFRKPMYVRLAPDEQSKWGGLWNIFETRFRNWELNLHFRVTGNGKHLYGDGFAIWLTDSPMYVPGPLFGAQQAFRGLGVFFDTYQNEEHHHMHPFVSAVVSSAKKEYTHDADGVEGSIGSCTSFFRHQSPDMSARLRLTYLNRRLSLLIDPRSANRWDECFAVDDVHIPTGLHFGLSAGTGHLADNHDVFGVEIYDLDHHEEVLNQRGEEEIKEEMERQRDEIQEEMNRRGEEQPAGVDEKEAENYRRQQEAIKEKMEKERERVRAERERIERERADFEAKRQKFAREQQASVEDLEERRRAHAAALESRSSTAKIVLIILIVVVGAFVYFSVRVSKARQHHLPMPAGHRAESTWDLILKTLTSPLRAILSRFGKRRVKKTV